MTRLTKISWFILCVAVLLHYALNRHAQDAGIAASYLMIALSFPSGWIGAVGSGWLFLVFDRFFGYTASKDSGVIFFWLLALALGYLQWFVLLPYVLKKLKARRSDHVS